MDASSQLARSAARQISQDFLADHSLEDLAARLGVTDRQMRRAFRNEFGVSPVEFWQTQRLLLAKQLLTDSKMPVTTVAFASGFQSLRRFNALLKQRYRLTPTDLRKRHGDNTAANFSDFSFRLSYRPPLDWQGMLGFFRARAIPNVEAVLDGAYLRTVRIKRQDREFVGHIEVRNEPRQNMLSVRLTASLLPVCAFVLERTRQLFDLHADPLAIHKTLRSLTGIRAGLRVPGSFDAFETATRAILGQQISVPAARTLAGRLALQFGQPVATPIALLTHLFPQPAAIAATRTEQIIALGITQKRAATLLALAQEMASGRLLLEPGHRIEQTIAQLKSIPGIGPWTAQYIAMRALAWPDAFPDTDLGIRKALRETDSKKILEMAEQWRPWRAYAALHFWTKLEAQS